MLRYERIIIQTVIIVILILTNWIVSMMIPLGYTVFYTPRAKKQLRCFIMYVSGFVNVIYLLKEGTGCRKIQIWNS